MTNKNMDVECNKNGRNRFQEERHDNDFDKTEPSEAEASNDPQAEEKNAMAEKVNEYLRDCLMEKSKMEKTFPIAARLLDNEIEKVQSTGRLPTREPRYADVYREKPIRVSQKVLVPVREHPKFNFVGKLLGPKGNSLRRLQEETLCKMTVLGRNSMKDRAKEEELRASMDPKYAHLNSDLHVEISTIAPPAEAHARIAYAMAELRKYLIPDSNDVIRQEQLRELLVENPNLEFEHKPGIKKSSAAAPPAKPPPPYKPVSGPPSNNRTAIPPKQKVLSILDKARTAMDESYRYPSHSRHYEEPSTYEPPSSYESYPYAPPSGPTRPYEPPEYEPEYRREYYSSPGGYPAKSPTSTPRPSWKPTPAGGAYASRRHDEAPPSAGPAPTKHSSREARYKTAPYPRANNY